MPDLLSIVEAGATAVLAAAVVAILFAQPWRMQSARSATVGGVLATGSGFYAGCAVLRLLPRWPPVEAQDRFQLVLFPALLAIELVAVWLPSRRALIAILRGAFACAIAPVLLYHTIYISDVVGPGSREWSPAQTGLIFVGLAAALAVVWILLAWLGKRPAAPSIPLAVALASVGGALVIMLSGYATGGALVVPLAGAVVGASSAAFFVKGGCFPVEGVIGAALGGLFSLLLMGRFFGELSTANAAWIFCGLLLCWSSELPCVRRAGPWLKGGLRMLVVAVPVAAAVWTAHQKFAADSATGSSRSDEAGAEDYKNLEPAGP